MLWGKEAMPNYVELFNRRGQSLVTFDQALTTVGPAFAFAMGIRKYDYVPRWRVAHRKEHVTLAKEERDRLIKKFGGACDAHRMLNLASRESPDHDQAAAMVADLLGAYGQKIERRMLAGMLAVLGGDRIAVSGLWKPTNISVASLGLACLTLLTNNKFLPKPAELHAACIEAHRLLKQAEQAAKDLVDHVRRCDAVLLDFDHDEWERPYLTPEFAPILRRMLDLHIMQGDGSEAYEQDDHPFEAKVIAEIDKLVTAPDSPPVLKDAAT